MANKGIKGITIEIGGDTTQLEKALSGVNGKVRNTQAELREVNKLLKMSDGELRETQTANYFSNLYPIDCAVPSVDA